MNMIKETIKNNREEMVKKHTVGYLVWGVYDKKVTEEDGLTYAYKHSDCFLLNDEKNPTSVIRLTGEAVQRTKQIDITRLKKIDKTLIATDNNHPYEISLLGNNRIILDHKTSYLEEANDVANFVNYTTRNKARQEAILKSQTKSEFSKQL